MRCKGPGEPDPPAIWLISRTRAFPGPGRGSRNSTLKLEMLLRENAIGEHIPRTGLHGMLRQQSGGELGGGFPDSRLQARIKMSKLRPEPNQSDPAIELCQGFLPDRTVAGAQRTSRVRVACLHET